MKVGLIDLDKTDFPNLALMKISAFHKSMDDDVEWYDPMFGGYYDIVYQSKVFSFSENYPYEINADLVLTGGCAIKDSEQLDLDRIMPDYSLYGIEDTAYGFLTRGCYNDCPYCIVPKIDGHAVRKVATVYDFWDGQKNIKIMDSNLLGLADRHVLNSALRSLWLTGASIDFNQGLDIRLMDKEIMNHLKRMRIKRIHFAWDDPRDKMIPLKLRAYKNYMGWSRDKVTVYVLTNYWSTLEEDLERIYEIREIGFQPYVMIYDKHLLPRGHVLLKLQRWCNSPMIFNSTKSFDDYVHGKR